MTTAATLAEGVNLMWVLTVTFLIFFMHAGFAMLEAGQVRAKNVANQLTKNLLTWSVGVMAFFLVGAAVATIVGALTGGGSVSVGEAFASQFSPENVNAWVSWLFGAVFAMTAATIVSGAVAGRCKLRTYVTYTFLLAAIVYPVVVGFTWAGGFLSVLGFHDFAGGMVVHGMGGIAGLTAAAVIGPRLGKYDSEGNTNVIPGHSITFAVLGTLILAFGWYGFNVGTAASVFAAENGSLSLGAFSYVGRVALVTTLGMAAGAIGAAAVAMFRTGKVDTLSVANGLLAGLVCVTGIADAIVWPGAIAVGLVCGGQLPVVFEFVEDRLKIDDVCAVFPVHGTSGIIGALAFPLIAVPSASASFTAQIAGVLVIGVWTVAATVLVFGAAKALGQARVSPAHEREGLDHAEHGVDTYPEFGHTEPGRAEHAAGAAVGDGGSDPVTDGGKDSGIKMVTAIIRPDRLGEVKQALAEVGAPSLTVTNVSGRGSQPAKTGQWRGEEYVVDLHQKVKIECVVASGPAGPQRSGGSRAADVPAEDVAQAIREGANTGEPGDGKVFILPVEDAIQVRTGKRGTEAV